MPQPHVTSTGTAAPADKTCASSDPMPGPAREAVMAEVAATGASPSADPPATGALETGSAQRDARQKAVDSEKITINLGPIDLGQIDLLVSEGFYANRTDLIRTAIRNQLNTHADVVRQTVARRSLVLGMHHYARTDLEAARAAGERLQIQVLGFASIASDVTVELALATIESVLVLGALHASPEVKAALAQRMQ